MVVIMEISENDIGIEKTSWTQSNEDGCEVKMEKKSAQKRSQWPR